MTTCLNNCFPPRISIISIDLVNKSSPKGIYTFLQRYTVQRIRTIYVGQRMVSSTYVCRLTPTFDRDLNLEDLEMLRKNWIVNRKLNFKAFLFYKFKLFYMGRRYSCNTLQCAQIFSSCNASAVFPISQRKFCEINQGSRK